MKKNDSEILRKVAQWFLYADEDLNMATKVLADKEDCPYRLVAFHAQQCAEKYLKAFLVYHGEEFPYTHNISTLLELCGEHANWPGKLIDAEELTQYAITARYHGEDSEVTEEEAERAVELAKQVRQEVRTSLKDLGLDS